MTDRWTTVLPCGKSATYRYESLEECPGIATARVEGDNIQYVRARVEGTLTRQDVEELFREELEQLGYYSAN